MAPSWSTKVHWERADIVSPASYAPLLRNADYIVHSMGILLEADYKGALTGQVSPVAGLRRAFSSTKAGSQNPLTRSRNEDLRPQEADGQFTYEFMNRDSAIALAREANEAGAKAFAYVSAAAGAPILPTRYIETKREAEKIIATQFPSMRGVFVRPSFLFDESRWVTMGLAAGAAGGSLFNTVTAGIFSNFIGAGGVWPQRVDRVAAAVVEALGDEDVKGPIETQEIEALADREWRRGML